MTNVDPRQYDAERLARRAAIAERLAGERATVDAARAEARAASDARRAERDRASLDERFRRASATRRLGLGALSPTRPAVDPSPSADRAGEVLLPDYQADVYQQPYRLVERLADGRWVVETLALSPETLAAIEADPYGGPTEVARRVAAVGDRSTVGYISAERYAEYF